MENARMQNGEANPATKVLRRSLCGMLAALAMGVAAPVTAQVNKTETITYHDDPEIWVVGQVAKVTCASVTPTSAVACDGGTDSVVSETTYDATYALPTQTKAFGKPQQTLTYDTASAASTSQRGTLKTVADGRGNVTTLTQWKRGVPGKVAYPATTDQPTAVSQSAVVNDDGTIAQVTDENTFVTKYDYDAMGRLSLIDYPDSDTVNWTSTTLYFKPWPTPRYGLPAGHWVQGVATGNGVKVIDYDALWRPVVESTYVAGDTTSYSIVVKRYDAGGRLAFQSYPLASLSNYADTTLKGTYYTYDALDRVMTAKQDWEGAGQLTTTTEYLTGFKTRVTLPRHNATTLPQQTTTSYQIWDQPITDFPVAITHPAGVFTDIVRDVFGKPLSIKRRNAGNTLSAVRSYNYYNTQELCRIDEPETGVTALGYDLADNLTWSASGVVTTATGCLHPDWVASRRADRTYDARNRLKTLSFANGRGNTTSTYTPDNLLTSIAADNGDGNIVTQNYTYNRRRLLESEQMLWGSINWPISYDYNTNGHLSDLTSIGGLLIDYAPDALGRPTKAGAYASGVSYYPNGAIKGFNYANGLKHSLTQNVRGLPDTSCDFTATGACDANAILNDGYDYDQNGNVAAISDGRTGNRGNRTMTYDALDRLTMVGSRMFGATGAVTNAFYFYDVLDNLTRAKILNRDQYYCYNAKWQVAFLRTGPTCTGSTPSQAVLALEYDEQGNQIVKDNADFDFDFGNRLRSVSVNGTPLSSYVYDGHGRRVRDFTTASKYSLYSNSGQLLFDSDARKGVQHWYIYVGGSLAAVRERNTSTGAVTNEYQHTDALGSPVAVTNASGVAISAEKTEYEPYGKVINRPNSDGPGYTGHVMDAATGLNYMQQRYYDPMLGRFLSVDPVTALSDAVAHFNGYAYAYNNPYKFIDPDGRCGSRIEGHSAAACTSYDLKGPAERSSSVPEAPRMSVAQFNASAPPPSSPGESTRNWFTGEGSLTDIGALAHDVIPPLLSTPAGGGFKIAGSVGLLAAPLGKLLSGISVLGHYPGYVRTAESIGARYFSIPARVWDRMSPARQWAANTRFLDRLAARGDTIILSTPAAQARAGSWYARELEYMASKGYVLDAAGTRMLPP